jgi:DNA polymerase III epsilon subunit-like protein
MKRCFVDLETTGLNPWKNNARENDKGVILSAGFVLETGPELEVIITPTVEEWGYASPQALQVNGMTWDFLKEKGMLWEDAAREILRWLAEYEIIENEWVFYAQNAPFDKKFLLHFLGDWLTFLDVPTVWVDLIPIYKNVGRKLGLNVHYQNTHHISQQLGVPEEPKPHQAIEGARALKRNYDALRKLAAEKDVLWPEHDR